MCNYLIVTWQLQLFLLRPIKNIWTQNCTYQTVEGQLLPFRITIKLLLANSTPLGFQAIPPKKDKSANYWKLCARAPFALAMEFQYVVDKNDCSNIFISFETFQLVPGSHLIILDYWSERETGCNKITAHFVYMRKKIDSKADQCLGRSLKKPVPESTSFAQSFLHHREEPTQYRSLLMAKWQKNKKKHTGEIANKSL